MYHLASLPYEISYTLIVLYILLCILTSNGEVHLLDMDELASAHKDGLISDELMHKSLIRADRLLKIAYSGSFSKYADLLNSFIE